MIFKVLGFKFIQQIRTYGTVEDETGKDEVGALPAAELLQQVVGEGREGEGADAGAADGDASGERALGLEVVADGHHRRQVDEAEADAAHDTVRQHQHRHVGWKRRQDKRRARHYGTRDANGSAPEFVGQRRNYGTCINCLQWALYIVKSTEEKTLNIYN